MEGFTVEVPGRQTAPRAEAWAFLAALRYRGAGSLPVLVREPWALGGGLTDMAASRLGGKRRRD